MKPSNILIAGASGFVGRALIECLLIEFPEATIIALSRNGKPSSSSRVVWRQCDLFSEESVTQAMPDKVDLAYYLVHSMEPTARLDQGSFADYDLILADNFARACRLKNVRQLVYLGGLIPDKGDLSRHLQSRLEVETVFEEYKIPYTFFRAGLILGESGSSFQILLKLVKRLHVMICPAWTQTLTSPVDLPAVISALVSAAKTESHLGRTYDLAGCRPLTYVDMMRLTAQHLGLKRFFVKVGFFTPTLSRLWLSMITNTSKYLVYPLIESLEHPMVARDSHSFYPESKTRDYLDLLKGISTRLVSKPSQPRARTQRPTVRSVQRMPVVDLDVDFVSGAYFNWLPKFTRGLVRVCAAGESIALLLFNRFPMIELIKVAPLSAGNRVTYAIERGALVKSSPSARLEFRLVLQKKFVVVAIHDYAPSLPWYFYRYTQAQAHQVVMWAFRRFLIRASSKKAGSQN